MINLHEVSERTRWVPRVWVCVLALVLLGPALAPGYVLSYDMVWVPHLAIRAETWGLGSLLPRNVPSDAFVALFNQVIPGMLLQKLVLVGSLAGAGLAALRYGGTSLVGRMLAGTVYIWNPFVAERLAIGHWPLLIAYAVLPVLITQAAHYRRSGQLRAGLLLAAAGMSMTPSSGVLAGVVLLALGIAWRRPSMRSALTLIVVSVLANAPWIGAGLAHLSDATSAQAGVSVFGLQASGALPAPLAALGLGGIWNQDVVPYSQTTPLAWLALAMLLPMFGWGLWLMYQDHHRRSRSLRTVAPEGDHIADLVVLWGLGYLLAILSWLAPGPMGWVAAHVPGGGIMRDGARWLALCAPLLTTAVVVAGVWLIRWAPRAVRPLLAIATVLIPMAWLPDAAFGVGGALHASSYPAEYSAARQAVEQAREQGSDGSLLLLPFSPYRAPKWNAGRPVLDPLSRYFAPNPVASDVLRIDGRPIEGESKTVQRVHAALESAQPAEQLKQLGIRFVVADLTPDTALPHIAGAVVHQGAQLTVIDMGSQGLSAMGPTTGQRALIYLGWAGFVTLLIVATTLWRGR